MTSRTLIESVLALPEADRIEAARLLMRSLPEAKIPEPFEEEQINEALRRSADVRAGRAKLIPGDEVFRELIN